MKTRDKLGLLGSLYLAQGLPFGFFTVALPVMMRRRDLSLPAISMTSALALPWALKFLWAPYVDRHYVRAIGRRRSWILPLQALSIASAVGLSLVDPKHAIVALMVALFVNNLLAATQDIATDGLAVELLRGAERGYGNGVQVAGYRVGMILGGSFLLGIHDRIGWSRTFLAMAAMFVVASVPIVFYREISSPDQAPPDAETSATPLVKASWIEVVKRPGMALWLGILAVYKAGEALAYGVVKPMLVDLGMKDQDIGFQIGSVGFGAGLAGALLGGVLSNRLGRTRAILACGAMQVMGGLAYVPSALHWGGKPMLVAASFVEHLTSGMATVSLFTLMMDVCREESSGTDYTVQASVVVAATGIASTLSGFMAARLGYAGHFVACSAVSAVGLAFIAWAFASRRAPPLDSR